MVGIAYRVEEDLGIQTPKRLRKLEEFSSRKIDADEVLLHAHRWSKATL